MLTMKANRNKGKYKQLNKVKQKNKHETNAQQSGTHHQITSQSANSQNTEASFHEI